MKSVFHRTDSAEAYPKNDGRCGTTRCQREEILRHRSAVL